jgi:hypothetical protein
VGEICTRVNNIKINLKDYIRKLKTQIERKTIEKVMEF